MDKKIWPWMKVVLLLECCHSKRAEWMIADSSARYTLLEELHAEGLVVPEGSNGWVGTLRGLRKAGRILAEAAR